MADRLTNDEIADVFDHVGAILRHQQADPYRVRAWEQGADFVRTFDQPLVDVLDQGGRQALIDLPYIGRSLAAAIDELAHTGRLAMLERMRGRVSPADLFTTIPGIGDELAHAIHDHLGVETLEELEAAAHDGRLVDVPGIGHRRAGAIRDHLDVHLSRARRRRARPARPHATGIERPPIQLLMALDAEYRQQADAGTLPTVAPHRFNPDNEAWLPVLHKSADGWHFTAMYSNTARAHELDRTQDWVVVYYEHDGHEDQCTIVTEYRGPHAGKRVVRGREAESAAWHRARQPEASPE